MPKLAHFEVSGVDSALAVILADALRAPMVSSFEFKVDATFIDCMPMIDSTILFAPAFNRAAAYSRRLGVTVSYNWVIIAVKYGKALNSEDVDSPSSFALVLYHCQANHTQILQASERFL